MILKVVKDMCYISIIAYMILVRLTEYFRFCKKEFLKPSLCNIHTASCMYYHFIIRTTHMIFDLIRTRLRLKIVTLVIIIKYI